jgi:hypothetical protein
MKGSVWSAVFALVLGLVVVCAACGGGGSPFTPPEGSGNDGGVADATVSPGDDGGTPHLGGDSGSVDASGPLVISPADPVITVTLGQTPSIPTQTFTATSGGVTVGPQWTIDRGEIGAIGVATGLFTPGGNLGGKATITADFQGRTATTTVTVKIVDQEIGELHPPDAGAPADAGDNSGGYRGVGGNPVGDPATATQIGVLNGTTTSDAALGLLYPYDKTVFPRGLLAPALQWSAGSHLFDAVLIHISEAYFDYKGYFQKNGDPFQEHVVPQSVWDALGYSNAGEDVTVELTFAEMSTGKAFGPITESWKIAQGTLKGTIFYNSYGTQLAPNLCCFLNTTKLFGGATLAIREGALKPELVAGSPSPSGSEDKTKCRVCHSVSANGSTLVTQHGDDTNVTSSYALTNGNTETTVPNQNSGGRFQYPALYPDGTLMFTHESPSALYDMTGATVAATGLTGVNAFLPAFSPDGTHVAFNVNGSAALGALDFAVGTKAFSNNRTLVTPASGNAYWPSFLPTNDALIYQIETVYNGRDTAGTRSQCDAPSASQGGNGSDPQPSNPCHSEGTHAELWWVDLATKTPTRLDNLNGKGYLPPHPTYTGGKGDDTTLNYEPTVNPVPSGGYAWVVFTSRRAYGNIATINPFWSDPRWEDISQTPTTKKLWVAAIDLNAKPGTDPSHPAFYLPAQELMAGNARGFWVVDPCHADGSSCVTGDECCGGYCRPGSDGGLMCTAQQPSCSQEFEKCTTPQDCCGNQQGQGITCINGRCATPVPR